MRHRHDRPWAYFPGRPWTPGSPPIGTVLPYAGLLIVADGAEAAAAAAEIATRLAATGWLPCDGRSLSRNDYPYLYDVVGNAFGGDDTHFNLPDLRGRFVRGVDGGSGRDPSSAKRQASAAGGADGDQVGSVQADAYQGHEHHYNAASTSVTVEAGEVAVFGPTDTEHTTEGQVEDDQGHGTPRVDKETRPVNLYLNYIIRYA